VFRHTTRILIVAGCCLGIAAPAAQADPVRYLDHRTGEIVVNTQHKVLPDRGGAKQGTVGAVAKSRLAQEQLRGGIAGGTAIVTPTQHPALVVKHTDSGYRDWVYTFAGAALAAFVLAIGVIAVRRTRSPAAA